MQKNYFIKVTGIVQGVGFRPFVYNLAESLNIKGEVANTSQGVIIKAEGSEDQLKEFISCLENNPPPLAMVERMEWEQRPWVGFENFKIIKSQGKQEKTAFISPDVAICKDCLTELMDEGDRRHFYPFINCTNCGPRFTIIEDVPYDRPKTTMKHFPMCASCQAEYEDPANRRFHAQPNACADCGPQVSLLTSEGAPLAGDAIKAAARHLLSGKIVAIKGLGGYHLACNAADNEAVVNLRSRKFREDKPFAVMFASLEEVSKYCYLNDHEEKLLSSIRRPIVLLRKKDPFAGIGEEVSPGNKFLGAMLPYTPIHYLLFRYLTGPLVMTSANVSDEPIAYRDEDALERLAPIADYFLTHNREIRHRCDDSVTRDFWGQEYLIRRSRGYAPAPLSVKRYMKRILACGGEQKNTFCLAKGNCAFLSHHIGDLENLETLEAYSEGIELYKKLFDIEPQLLAHDLHPEYLSTKYAMEYEGVPKVGVQHHHAHIVGCMAENNLEGKVIGVAFDGTGYGTDGNLWGGEFILADYRDFIRLAHLQYMPLPGGAAAIKEPWRMAAGYLTQIYSLDEIIKIGQSQKGLGAGFLAGTTLEKMPLLKDVIDKKINTPLTSSMGRLFDAVSALLNIRKRANYEGQGAVELEQIANLGINKYSRPYQFSVNGIPGTIDPSPLIQAIIRDLEEGEERSKIAFKFHLSVAELILRVCLKARAQYGVRDVCLSGGVFQNYLLLENTLDKLAGQGFLTYIHRLTPANDGGLSLGQAVIANERS